MCYLINYRYYIFIFGPAQSDQKAKLYYNA